MDASLRVRAEQLATEFAGQAQTAEDLNGFMRLMMQSALERMLNTEMDVHLGRRNLPAAGDPAESGGKTDVTSVVAAPAKPSSNRRNGRSRKTVQGDLGELTIATPRDRDGTFEPQLVGKHQRRLAGFDEKILALYAKGMTTRDIQDIVQQLYGVAVSATLISEITADLDAERPPGGLGRWKRCGPSSTSTASWCMPAAEQVLESFAQAWEEKYPTIAKMWRAKWIDIITLFDFPPPIRRAIYTTNAIESVNSAIRKFTRNRKIYPNEESALKIVYMAIREASRKWTMSIRKWKEALNHFAILFEGRMPK